MSDDLCIGLGGVKICKGQGGTAERTGGRKDGWTDGTYDANTTICMTGRSFYTMGEGRKRPLEDSRLLLLRRAEKGRSFFSLLFCSLKCVCFFLLHPRLRLGSVQNPVLK